MTTRKLLSDVAVDAIIGAAGFTLVLWVMGSTVPQPVPTDDRPQIIEPMLTPPAVPVPDLPPTPPASVVPIPDPTDHQDVIDAVCLDPGPPLPPPPAVCETLR